MIDLIYAMSCSNARGMIAPVGFSPNTDFSGWPVEVCFPWSYSLAEDAMKDVIGKHPETADDLAGRGRAGAMQPARNFSKTAASALDFDRSLCLALTKLLVSVKRIRRKNWGEIKFTGGVVAGMAASDGLAAVQVRAGAAGVRGGCIMMLARRGRGAPRKPTKPRKMSRQEISVCLRPKKF